MVSIPFRFHRLPRMALFSYMLHVDWRLKRLSSLDYKTRSNKGAGRGMEECRFCFGSVPSQNGLFRFLVFHESSFLARAISLLDPLFPDLRLGFLCHYFLSRSHRRSRILHERVGGVGRRVGLWWLSFTRSWIVGHFQGVF